MNRAIGDVLPLAIAIAISPLPVIAAILTLLSPRAKRNSLSFLLGWVLGILAGVVLFLLLSGLIPTPKEGPSPIVGTIKIVIGVLLVLIAGRQWRQRPRDGEVPTLPPWMKAIDSMTAARAASVAFALAAVNPKNIMMEASTGVSLGSAGLTVTATIITVAVFVLLAASTVATPVIINLVAGPRFTPTLLRMREWLIPNNAVIMTILMLVVGVTNIGNGIGRF
jgi:hypothetical protein